jgi:hypothetical protein
MWGVPKREGILQAVSERACGAEHVRPLKSAVNAKE